MTLLGTGTPAALLHRAGASYFVRLGDQELLFDCGPFAVHRLLEAGSRPTERHMREKKPKQPKDGEPNAGKEARLTERQMLEKRARQLTDGEAHVRDPNIG